jgi:hypothetical protein
MSLQGGNQNAISEASSDNPPPNWRDEDSPNSFDAVQTPRIKTQARKLRVDEKPGRVAAGLGN